MYTSCTLLTLLTFDLWHHQAAFAIGTKKLAR
jgi:hypothetical protein